MTFSARRRCVQWRRHWSSSAVPNWLVRVTSPILSTRDDACWRSAITSMTCWQPSARLPKSKTGASTFCIAATAHREVDNCFLVIFIFINLFLRTLLLLNGWLRIRKCIYPVEFDNSNLVKVQESHTVMHTRCFSGHFSRCLDDPFVHPKHLIAAFSQTYSFSFCCLFFLLKALHCKFVNA